MSYLRKNQTIMIVKIDRTTIRKNPDRGQRFITVAGTRTATFECEGKLPEQLRPLCDIMEWKGPEGDESWCSGYIVDPSTWEEFIKVKNGPKITVKVDNAMERIPCMPGPELLYSYENPVIPCENCGSGVPVKDVDFEWIGYEDEVRVSVCPHCKAMNSFGEIEFEDIYDMPDEDKETALRKLVDD